MADHEHVKDDGRPGPMAPRGTSAAITVASAFQGLMPSSLGEAFQLSSYLAKSTVVPKSLRNKPESILAVVMAGMELGLAPMRALNNITIISGNMAMKTDLQLAIVRRSGLLAYHDEGFELRGQSDQTLLQRAKDGQKILALVQAVPDGKPYGWCTVQRQGEDQLRTYVFTWVDADRVLATEWEEAEEEGGRGQKKTIKLADKHNYRNYPQSMYPRRARGAVLQVVFGDALAGIPAVEALEGGQVIQAEYTTADEPDDVEALMAKIQDQDSELATGITAGFEHLGANRARQLQLLTKYKDDPAGLYQWLRDEAARRHGKDQAPPKRTTTAAPAAPAEPAPAGTAAPAEPAKAGTATTTEPAPAAGGKLADLAARFGNGTGTGGTF